MRRTVVSDDGHAGHSEARLLSLRAVGHRGGEQRRRRRAARVRRGSGVFGSIHLSVFTAGGPPRYVSSETRFSGTVTFLHLCNPHLSRTRGISWKMLSQLGLQRSRCLQRQEGAGGRHRQFWRRYCRGDQQMCRDGRERRTVLASF